MLVDAHQHYWSLARNDYGWLTPDLAPIYRDFEPADLAQHLARHGIGRTVLVQAAPTIAETEYLLRLAQFTPSVAAVVGWIDFEQPQHRGHLQRWARNGKFRAVRPMLQDLPDPAWILKSDFDWVFRALYELGLHFEFLGLPAHLDTALLLLQRYPDLTVVLNHGLKPKIRDRAFEPWATKMTRIARTTTAICKLSGLATEALPGWNKTDLEPYVRHLVAEFAS